MFASMAVYTVIGILFLFLYEGTLRMTIIRYGVAIVFGAVLAFINRSDIITLITYVKKRISGIKA